MGDHQQIIDDLTKSVGAIIKGFDEADELSRSETPGRRARYQRQAAEQLLAGGTSDVCRKAH